MRIFVTGASGHIGSLVVRELLDHGHQVDGLARSDDSAAKLTAAGAEVTRGTLDDVGVLAEAAAAADGVIHLAFKHDFGDYEGAAVADLRAVEAMGAALAGTDKPFLNTSGTAMAAAGDSGARMPSENATLALAGQGIRASVVRLPPTVHGPTDHHGFIPTIIANARKTGQALYIGDGTNRWPAVHNLDAARLYRLAVESAPAGSRLNAVADEGIPFRDIAAAIGGRLGVPTVSVTAEEASAQLGFIGWVASLDNPTSGDEARKLLGWAPEHPGLLDDLQDGRYFG